MEWEPQLVVELCYDKAVVGIYLAKTSVPFRTRVFIRVSLSRALRVVFYTIIISSLCIYISAREISIRWRGCHVQPQCRLGSRSPRRGDMRARLIVEEGKLRGDLRAAAHCPKGDYRDEEVRLFSELCRGRTRGNGHELLQGKLQLYLKKEFISHDAALGQGPERRWDFCPWRL